MPGEWSTGFCPRSGDPISAKRHLGSSTIITRHEPLNEMGKQSVDQGRHRLWRRRQGKPTQSVMTSGTRTDKGKIGSENWRVACAKAWPGP